MNKIFKVLAFAIFGLTAINILISCEEDYIDLGGDLIGSGASGNAYELRLLAYNTNPDSIRSDSRRLQSGIVGVYEDAVFGRTKARFISQVRLGVTNPSFGSNPELDSVFLYIPVHYLTSGDDINIDTIRVCRECDEDAVDTLVIKTTYKLDSIYGNTDSQMNLQLKEVTSFLYSTDSAFYSNPALRPRDNIQVNPTIIGNLEINNKVTQTTIKVDNSDVNIYSDQIGYKMPLDNNFFKQKILNNATNGSLNDQANFIRNVINGFELSVVEENGFFFNFSSSDLLITMHYSFDNPTEQGENDENYQARLQSTSTLTFYSYFGTTVGYNTQIVQYAHSNRSAAYNNAINNPDTGNGSPRLYLNGLDGSRSVLEINREDLAAFKQQLDDNDWQIVNAEIRLYIDDSYSFKKPPFLMAWNQYTEDGVIKNSMFSDLLRFINSYPYVVQFNPRYNYADDPGYYTIKITDFLKSIVERDEVFENQKIILSLGNFLLDRTNQSTILSSNPFSNNRAYNPHRVVVHGNTTSDDSKRLKLLVYYTKK